MSKTEIGDTIRTAIRERVLPELLHRHPPPLLDLPAVRALADVAQQQDDATLLGAVLAAVAASRSTRDDAASPSLPMLCLEVLTPIAHELGARWTRDDIGFETVTVGIGRLHAVLRVLQRGTGAAASSGAWRILMLPAPGEDHRLGLSMALALFRDAGWTVLTGEFEDEQQLHTLLDRLSPDMVGFSASCDRHVAALGRAVRSVRRIRPGLPVVAGGSLFVGRPSLARRLRLDAVLMNGATAALEATRLLQDRHRDGMARIRRVSPRRSTRPAPTPSAGRAPGSAPSARLPAGS